ncbi:hypothetical protein DAL61_25015 [Salmonella enterica subsp. enterica serovar Enteritidis]|nr:hypothetical protein [Salmonella enterica subsp. enterica serovar Enteritidis]
MLPGSEHTIHENELPPKPGGFFMPAKRTEAQKEAEKRYDAKRRGERHQVWMGVFYEDSAPNWRQDIDEMGLPVAVSPVHDKDAWTKADEKKDPSHKAGAFKKPHRHWLAEYPNPVNFETVKKDFAFLNSSNIKWVKSKAAMAAYLCHLKSPDKAKYDPEGIVEFGGANWRDWCAQTDDLHGEMMAMRRHIMSHAQETGRADLFEFWNWCDENNDVWSRLLDTACSAAIERYMKTIRGAMKTGTWNVALDERTVAVIDEETGERLGEFGSDQDAADYCDYLGSLGRSVSMVGRNVPENAVRDGQGGWNYYTVDEETGPEYEC